MKRKLITILAAALAALGLWAQEPGDEYSGGTNANPGGVRSLLVVGSVKTNYLVVFTDNTGTKVRGLPSTNVVFSMASATTVTGPQSNALVTATAGVESNRLAILVALTNGNAYALAQATWASTNLQWALNDGLTRGSNYAASVGTVVSNALAAGAALGATALQPAGSASALTGHSLGVPGYVASVNVTNNAMLVASGGLWRTEWQTTAGATGAVVQAAAVLAVTNSATYTDTVAKAASSIGTNDTLLVIDGDSRSNPGYPNSWPDKVRGDVWGRGWVTNFSYSGRTVSNMVSEYSTRAHVYAPTGMIGKTIGFYYTWGGYNDYTVNAANPTNVFNNLALLWAAARTDGYHVVAFTDPGGNDGPTMAFVNALNALIRTNTAAYDYLVDAAAVIDATDPTQTSDGVHQSVGSAVRLGVEIQRVLDNRPYMVQCTSTNGAHKLILSPDGSPVTIPSGPLTVGSMGGIGLKMTGTGSLGGTDANGGAAVGIVYNAVGNKQLWFGSTDAGLGLRVNGAGYLDIWNLTGNDSAAMYIGAGDQPLQLNGLPRTTTQNDFACNSNAVVAGSLTVSNGLYGSGASLTGITAAQVGAITNSHVALANAGASLATNAAALYLPLAGGTTTGDLYVAHGYKTATNMPTSSELMTLSDVDDRIASAIPAAFVWYGTDVAAPAPYAAYKQFSLTAVTAWTNSFTLTNGVERLVGSRVWTGEVATASGGTYYHHVNASYSVVNPTAGSVVYRSDLVVYDGTNATVLKTGGNAAVLTSIDEVDSTMTMTTNTATSGRRLAVLRYATFTRTAGSGTATLNIYGGTGHASAPATRNTRLEGPQVLDNVVLFDAPNDGTLYGRQSSGWAAAPTLATVNGKVANSGGYATNLTVNGLVPITSTVGHGIKIVGAGAGGGNDPANGALIALSYNAVGNHQLYFGSSAVGAMFGTRFNGNNLDGWDLENGVNRGMTIGSYGSSTVAINDPLTVGYGLPFVATGNGTIYSNLYLGPVIASARSYLYSNGTNLYFVTAAGTVTNALTAN